MSPDSPIYDGGRRLLHRRTVLKWAAASCLAGHAVVGRAGRGGEPLRIVALDWALAATLVALGRPPIAVPDLQAYRHWVSVPALPPNVANLGSRFKPNVEFIARLRPDLIVTNSFLHSAHPDMSAIAPVMLLDIYTPEGSPLPNALRVTRKLAGRIDRIEQAEQLIARSKAVFTTAREAIPAGTPPLFLINILSARHVRVFGANSLLGDVLQRLSIANAWRGVTNYWGFSTVGVEALASARAARLAYFEPVPPGVLATIRESPIWRHLPAVKNGGLVAFPPVSTTGALPAAMRFAQLMTQRFGNGGGVQWPN